MSHRSHRPALMAAALAATALTAFTPAAAQAQTANATAREADLARRLAELEGAVAALRQELDATRAAQAAIPAIAPAQVDTNAAVDKRLAAVEARPTPPAEGFRTGSSTIKLGGFIKTVASFSRWDDGDVAANSLGRDFYLPQAIPIGGVRESRDSDVSAKQTRLWMNIATDVAGHKLTGYVETDFQTATGTQGSERTTNGYNLALRRAFVTVDKFTVGQDWSSFQYVAALPESTDFVGTTEGTPFVRQPLVRYTTPAGKGTTFLVSLENGETATAVAGAPALVENDDDRLPDFAARVVHTAKFGEVSLGTVLRQLSVDNGVAGDRALGWGVSGGGKFWLNTAKTADARVLVTYGKGLGRYVGLNFAPDAIVATGVRLRPVTTFAAMAAVRVPLSKNLRANIMGSMQNVDYPSGFAAGVFNNFNEEAWSVAGNLFWSPVKNVDVGVELRHGERGLVDGRSGQLNRLEFAAKYNF